MIMIPAKFKNNVGKLQEEYIIISKYDYHLKRFKLFYYEITHLHWCFASENSGAMGAKPVS
jgi:hypothetical protein